MENKSRGFILATVDFITPFMFVYGPGLLLEGSLINIIRALITALIGVIMFVSGVQRYFFGSIPIWVSTLFIIASLLMITQSIKTDILGLLIAIIAIVTSILLNKKSFVIIKQK